MLDPEQKLHVSSMATITETHTIAPSVKVQRAKNPDGSALYPDYLPFYDPLETVKDIGEFEHFDPGNSGINN